MNSLTAKLFDTFVVLSERAAPALLAVMVGSFLILGVGFAHPEALHSAAHDMRHAFALPCH